MAHEIDHSLGRPAFAFDGEEGGAWHGLGQPIPAAIAKDPQKIAELVGAAYRVYKTPISFETPKGKRIEIEDRQALVRDDTHAALGIFGRNYHEVQPVEYFEAFRDSLAKNNLRISSAGVLKGGRIVFVNAALGAEHSLRIGDKGSKDTMSSYACMGGGYDGTLASFGYLSSMRTVCWNTFNANISRSTAAKSLYRVMHLSPFDGKALGSALGLAGDELRVRAELFNTLAGYKLQKAKVQEYFCKVLDIDPADVDANDKDGKPKLSGFERNKLEQLADSFLNGPGATLPTAKGTAYGAFNAVTFFVDHLRNVRADGEATDKARFTAAHFGTGARLKTRALEAIMDMAGIKSEQLLAA